mgnify:CR=1 FL=1
MHRLPTTLIIAAPVALFGALSVWRGLRPTVKWPLLAWAAIHFVILLAILAVMMYKRN